MGRLAATSRLCILFLLGIVISLAIPGNLKGQDVPDFNLLTSPQIDAWIAGFDTLDATHRETLLKAMVGTVSSSTKANLGKQIRTIYALIRFLVTNRDRVVSQSVLSWIQSSTQLVTKEEDKALLSRAYSNFGIYLKNDARYADSEEVFMAGLSLIGSQKNPDDLVKGALLSNFGNTLKQIGEVERSLDCFTESIICFDRCIQDPDRTSKPYRLKVQSLNNLGLLYQSVGQPEKAIESYELGIRIKEEQGISYEEMLYTNLAITLLETRQLSEAQANVTKILTLKKQAGIFDRITVQAEMLQGQLYQQMESKVPKSLQHMDSVYNLLVSNLPSAFDLQLEILLQRADLLRILSQTSKALDLLNHGIQLTINSYRSADRVSFILMKAQILNELWQRDQKLSYLDEALKEYELASSLLDSTRNTLVLQSSQIELSRRQERTYDAMVSLALSHYEKVQSKESLSRLWDFIERSKSGGLWASMVDVNLKSDLIGEADQKFERELNSDLAEIQSKINDLSQNPEGNRELLNQLREKSFSIKFRRDSLVQSYKDRYPDYFQSKSDLKLLSLDNVQSRLLPEEMVLQYSMVGESILCLGITRDSQLIRRIVADDSLMNSMRKMGIMMNGSLASFNAGEKKSFYLTSRDLFDRLIGPFGPWINGHDLIILPDGELNFLPFGALVKPLNPEPKTLRYRDFQYLIRDHSIRYGFTATLFYHSNRSKKPQLNLLAVAPDYNPKRIKKSERLNRQSESLPYLAGIRQEARTAARILSGNLQAGPKANEGHFKKQCERYSVLHLAMHTLMDTIVPENSCLVFTPDGNSSKEDGLLFSHEIYNLRLNADLVVLSACETGMGAIASGEGIMSLGRAFLFAGSPNMIMTLWKVDDQSGREIMEGFYKNIGSGHGISEALRASQLSYLDNAEELNAHPYFWAAFTPIGLSQMINFPNDKNMDWIWILLVGLTISLILIWVYRIKNPHR